MNVLDALSSCAGAAAVVPPLVYLLSISFLDNRPVPARAIVGSFAFAALGAYLLHHVPLSATGWGTYVFQYVAYSFDASVEGQTPGVLWTLVQAFVDVAAPEEAAKLLILVAFSRRYLKFNHPLEGVVLGAAVGLGFAAYENLLLVVHLPEEWSDDQLIRSILTVPMHGALGVIAGIYVARARFSSASGAGVRSGCRTTTAMMSCSPTGLGTPMTAASFTSGWLSSSVSTSKDDTFSPRRRMASFTRSTK